jgi:hypothetical protein
MATQDKKGFLQLVTQSFIYYVRFSSTVVIAVVVRICLDCVGIILTDQEPAEVSFWFAHCDKAGRCVLAGIALFFASLAGCSAFAWGCQDWLLDPSQNPYARRYSFAIILEAATWIPISVVVGKTNALVEWFMDIAKDDLVQAMLSSAVSALLTITCALLTHLAMKYCRGVQESKQVHQGGWIGFGKFLVLATLYCLGWAVAWSNWELVLSVMDALEPGQSTHNALLAGAVVAGALVLATCFYLRYGPEPIVPDKRLQQVCYSHGYSSSVRRSLVSYVVYSCVIFIVMCCCDPNYGIFTVIVRKAFYDTLFIGIFTSVFDRKALLVLFCVACLVTLLGALLAAAIKWVMEVDESTSMKLSRSVHDACQLMVYRRRSQFDSLLTQVLEDGSDARFVEARELRQIAGRTVEPPDESGEGDLPGIIGGDAAEDLDRLPGIDDRNPGADDSFPEDLTPRSHYTRMDPGPWSGLQGDRDGDGSSFSPTGYSSDIESERQLQLDPGAISRTLCTSVLIYDVLGLVVSFYWGAVAIRAYSVLFGRLASTHDAFYALSCLLYAACVVASLSRFVLCFFPSDAELYLRTVAERQKEEFDDNG